MTISNGASRDPICRIFSVLTESFRPLESASIDAGLRIRLEGRVELLEDALPLLDSLGALMGRDEPASDDVGTLNECVNQLPRIAEAIDRANLHSQATALTREVGARVRVAHEEANKRLRRMNSPEQPSLRAAVSNVLELLRKQGKPPGPAERVFMTSPNVSWLLAFAIGSGVAVTSSMFGPLAPLLGAGAFVITLLMTASRPWVLLADRLHLPAHRGAPSRDVLPSSIGTISAQQNTVRIESDGEVLELKTSTPQELVSVLCLFKSPLLGWLKPTAGWSTLVDAVDEASGEQGRALMCMEGVLFVPASRAGLVLAALTHERLPAPPSLDAVLRLFAHVSTERWPALAHKLQAGADARWFPQGGTVVEDSANSQLGITVRTAGSSVRLNYSGNSRDLVQVRALLEALVG